MDYTNKFFCQILSNPPVFMEQRFNNDGAVTEVRTGAWRDLWMEGDTCTWTMLVPMQVLQLRDTTLKHKLKVVPKLYSEWTSWPKIRR